MWQLSGSLVVLALLPPVPIAPPVAVTGVDQETPPVAEDDELAEVPPDASELVAEAVVTPPEPPR